MTYNITKSAAPIHELPKELLAEPLAKRFELAMQHWMDLYPASTSLRFGQDHESARYFLTENMYGPRLYVMSNDDYWNSESNMTSQSRGELTERDRIAQKMGVRLRPALTSDPSVELFYNPRPNLQYEFRKELVTALNYGLAQIGSRTHSVALSDHTPQYNKLFQKYWSGVSSGYNDETDQTYEKMKALEDPSATLVWQKTDAFAPTQPDPAAIAALTEFFNTYPTHPVVTHVKLGVTIEVQPLNSNKWVPLDQTEVERIEMKAKADLSKPEHPWIVERGIDANGKPRDNQYYGYLASLYPVPPVRNGNLLYEGLRFDLASDENVHYVVIGQESSGTSGINRDAQTLMQDASNGQMSQVTLNLSKLPDLLLSAAYHAQVVAHQKERAAWLQTHPIAYAAAEGPVITKAVSDLQVGDNVGISSGPQGKPDLWCKVTKREGNVATMFVHNGHWDFKLDLDSNQSLSHDIVKDFAGKAQVIYTAPIPIKDPALYNAALDYMAAHMASQTPAPNL